MADEKSEKKEKHIFVVSNSAIFHIYIKMMNLFHSQADFANVFLILNAIITVTN